MKNIYINYGNKLLDYNIMEKNILITHVHLCTPHGSETWTSIICQELMDIGYNVYVYTPEINEDYFNQYFKNVIRFNIDDHSKIVFDYVILQHVVELRKNKKSWLKVEQVIEKSKNVKFICHGIIYNATSPVRKSYLKKNSYFCISPEIANKHRWFKWNIIKQPINNEWFDLPNRETDSLQKILYASHRHRISPQLEEECEKRNIELIHIGKKLLYSHDIQQLYTNVDLIIGTGRWIYEAMASKRNCIVADHRYTLGYVTLNNVKSFEYNNMTLRHKDKYLPDWSILLDNYVPTIADELQNYAKENYHVSKIVKLLIK